MPSGLFFRSASFGRPKVARVPAFFATLSRRRAAGVARFMFTRLEAVVGSAESYSEDEETGPGANVDDGSLFVREGSFDEVDIFNDDMSRTNNDPSSTVSSASARTPNSSSHGPRTFLNKITPGPFAALAAATVVQTCAGLTYSFGVYSDDLRKVFHGREAVVALLGTVKDSGAYFGLPGGYLYDRYGAFATLLCGAVMHVGGFLGVYRVLTQKTTTPPSLWWTSLTVFVASNGNSLFDTAALLHVMRCFPHDSGKIGGVLKAYLGLSSAIFQQMFATFVPVGGANTTEDTRSEKFVLLLAFVGGTVAVVGAPFFLGAPGVMEDTRPGDGRFGESMTPRLPTNDAPNTSRGSKKMRAVVLTQLNYTGTAVARFPNPTHRPFYL